MRFFGNNSLLTESYIFDISTKILRIFFCVFWYILLIDYITETKIGLI